LSNNRSNNRRRGRGNNNRSQGGNQLNRIDSRARGNAPQLLEKYRKLAHDASLNGDRVQAEYYLQFADHYFRVIADSRAQKDEGRPRREVERDSSDDYDYYDDDQMEPRGRSSREDSAGYDDSERESERAEESGDGEDRETAENPFVRDSRNRNRRPRRTREPEADSAPAEEPARPQQKLTSLQAAIAEISSRQKAIDHEASAPAEEPAGLDPSALPPAISPRDEGVAAESTEEPEAPRRRGRPRARRKGDDEALEAVG